MEKVKVSDPMRLFTLVVSPIFVGIGVMAIASGNSDGWLIAGFFSLCLLVAIFEPWFRKPWVSCDYRLVMTKDEIACEHPKRQRESIRWENVNRIWYVTTSDGPRLPDEWLLLEGEHGGCSFPTEAKGFDGIWDELQQRFAGFDYKPIIQGGTNDAKHLCWKRTYPSSS
ncbi:MAG TPA: hypothetical protein VLG74_03590 [Blastocatellia bacterium]|nr:hypothetical protein [Blastocatellia bacterium]